ncbi:MAG: hypothetical protein ACYDC5_09005 [Candidatus Dormibacteria bacterium]
MPYDWAVVERRANAWEALKRAVEDADGPRAVGGRKVEAVRLTSGPRVLKSAGSAAADAWEIAGRGIRSAAAYDAPVIGGWHWAAVIGPELRESAGSVLLTIGPDAARAAELYGSDDEAWSDVSWIEDNSERSTDCSTPADFARIVAGLDPVGPPEVAAVRALEVIPADPVPVPVAVAVDLPALEPLVRPADILGPLPWVPAPVELPEFARIRARWAATFGPNARPVSALEPVAVADDPEPVPALEPVARSRWAGLRGWVADQVAAIVGPWNGSRVIPDLRPRLVRMES